MTHIPHKIKTGYRRILMSALLILWFCGTAAASVTELLTSEERRWLAENQSRITLAIETGYPPFVFIDDNDQPAGLAHDYMALVESRLGVRFNQKRFSSLNDIFEQVRAGEVHIVNAVTQTPWRSTFLSFTDPFIRVPNVIVMRKEHTGKVSEADLAGLKVSLVNNYAVTEYLTGRQSGMKPDLVADDATALLHVAFGLADAAVIDLATATWLISHKGITNLRIAGEAAVDIHLSMGVPVTEPILYGILQKGLAAITDAEKGDIRKQWINAPIATIFDDWRLRALAGGSLFVILAVIAGILVWNRTLRKEVALQTESLRKEKNAFQESEARNRALLDTIPDMIFLLNRDGVFVDYHAPIRNLLYVPPEEFLNKNMRDVLPAHITAAFEDIWARLPRQGESRLLEYTLDMPDGPHHFEAHIALYRDDGLLASVRDITGKKNLENQLVQSQKMEFIGTLAGGIAHDLNNILFPISGLSEMLLDTIPPDNPDHELIEQIHQSAKRGSDLVKQILAISRQSNLQKLPIRIQPILKEVLKLSRSTIPANIGITSDIDPICGMISAYPTHIHQILMNLITNAYHAVENNSGSIHVALKEIRYEPDEQRNNLMHGDLSAGRCACITISDTGTGIDPELIHKIFEPYFTTKTQGKGTGLGLSVVHGIVKELGGNIRLDSDMGRGTTFQVMLPLLENDRDPSDAAVTGTNPAGSENILIVDDEEPIVRMEKMMLEKLGYQVRGFTGSPDALAAFKEAPDRFDLVISDRSMPDMTGEQLAREMIAIKPDIRVILSTGFYDETDERRAREMGIRGFLMKPVNSAELAAMVRHVLDE